MKTKEEVLNFIKTKPYKIGHMLGFNDLNEINNEWIVSMITEKEDKTLQGHRGSYKTTCLSISISILMITKPTKRILFQRKTEDDVKEVVAQVKNILKSKVFEYFVKCLYGEKVKIKLIKDSATEVTTNLVQDIKGTSQLVGIGTKGSLTGKHFDYIFTDDIVNIEDRSSRAERERTKKIYFEMQNIKNRGGRIFNTGTPWHKEDAFINMPNIVRYDYKMTGLMSDEEIEYLKETLPKSLWAANYELRHVAEDDVIFTNPQTGYDFELCKNGTSHLDSAYDGEDWTAFTVAKEHDGYIYVFGKCWRKHIENVMDEIEKWHNETLAEKMYSEKNADKGFVVKEFKARGVRAIGYDEKQNKYIKIVTHLKFNWKNIRFVEGTDEEYINQICDYSENAPHDDCPDSLASLVRKIRPKPKRNDELGQKVSELYPMIY